MAAPTIVFLHGAWVTPACWNDMKGYFEARGYHCLAPAWPGKDRSVEAIRQDPSPLADLGIAEITAAYETVVRGLPEPPILIGHSFGGLFTQLLLDRGLGAAGVAIDPAPPRGVAVWEPSAFRSLFGVLATWRGWRKVVRWRFENFRYAFVHTLPEADARAAFGEHVTPETGRVFFQGALSIVDPKGPARINFANTSRAPLLLIAGTEDRIVPASVVRRTFRKYGAAASVTELREFEGRTHWIIAEPGWEDVAGAIERWLAGHGLGVTAEDAKGSTATPAG
jgi:pimeloyl-ACP methyl ester carboxylesterase